MIVDGSIIGINSKLRYLKNITEINGDLNLENSIIQNLGKLKIATYVLNLTNTINLKSLENIEEVGYELNLTNSDIEDLGKLKHVGLELPNRVVKYVRLNLSNCEYLTSLGNLEIVNGEINLTKSSVMDLGKLKKCDKIIGFTGDKSKYPQFTFS